MFGKFVIHCGGCKIKFSRKEEHFNMSVKRLETVLILECASSAR
jgi:hypothetical protein